MREVGTGEKVKWVRGGRVRGEWRARGEVRANVTFGMPCSRMAARSVPRSPMPVKDCRLEKGGRKEGGGEGDIPCKNRIMGHFCVLLDLMYSLGSVTKHGRGPSSSVKRQ